MHIPLYPIERGVGSSVRGMGSLLVPRLAATARVALGAVAWLLGSDIRQAKLEHIRVW